MAVLAMIETQSVQSNSSLTDAIEERRKSLVQLGNLLAWGQELSPSEGEYEASWGRWGSNPRPEDYEVAANGRNGPVRSDSSGFERKLVRWRRIRPVASVWYVG